MKHSANPCADGSREGQRFEYVAMTDDDLSITISQPTFFNGTDCRDLHKVRSENRPLTFYVPTNVSGKT